MCGVLLFGCAHTNTTYVTPWLRTVVREPAPTILAESGGPKPVRAVERYDDHGWQVISPSGRALAIAKGERVLLEGADYRLRLVDRHQDFGVLPCEGSVRTRNEGSDITCVEVSGASSADTAPVPVVVKHFDSMAKPIGAPQSATLAPNLRGGWSERHFIGYASDGAPVVSMANAIGEGAEATNECVYYAIRSGAERLATGVFPSRDCDCEKRSCWRAVGLTIDEGRSFASPNE